MKHFRLEDMVKGWVVGGFDPAVLRTDDFEVAVKHYRAGDREDAHVHVVATEVTVIVSGTVHMLGRDWSAGDIVVVEPGTLTAFHALSDAVNVVIKVPSVAGDKYPATIG